MAQAPRRARVAPGGRLTPASVEVDIANDLCWIRILPTTVDIRVADEIRLACLEALERGVANIVIELTGVIQLCADGVDALQAAADELHAKHGTLSLANRHDENVGRIDFRHVHPADLDGLDGLSAALDTAIASHSDD